MVKSEHLPIDTERHVQNVCRKRHPGRVSTLFQWWFSLLQTLNNNKCLESITKAFVLPILNIIIFLFISVTHTTLHYLCTLTSNQTRQTTCAHPGMRFCVCMCVMTVACWHHACSPYQWRRQVIGTRQTWKCPSLCSTEQQVEPWRADRGKKAASRTGRVGSPTAHQMKWAATVSNESNKQFRRVSLCVRSEGCIAWPVFPAVPFGVHYITLQVI